MKLEDAMKPHRGRIYREARAFNGAPEAKWPPTKFWYNPDEPPNFTGEDPLPQDPQHPGGTPASQGSMALTLAALGGGA